MLNTYRVGIALSSERRAGRFKSVGLAAAPLLLIFACALGPAVETASAQYGYHFGRNKVQYEDFDWQVMNTEHFDIYYYPEMLDVAEHGAFFAEEAYKELQNRFSFSLNNRVPIVFYSSTLHFQQTNVTGGFIPDGVGGFFEFLKGRVVIPSNGNLHQFRRVIRHELVHVFTYNKMLRVMRDHRKPMDTRLPLWFTEGLAEYWAAPPDQQHEMVIRDALFTNYLVPLESMARINGSYVMYKQGEAICRFVSEVYGEEKILEIIENAWKDRDIRVILEVTLKEPFEDIADHWLNWLKVQYYPELEEVELPSLIAGGLATKGFNAKPNFFRFPDGRRRVYFVSNDQGYSNVSYVQVDEDYRPMDDPKVLIKGGRSDEFEAFHLFESRIDVSPGGKLAFVTKSGGEDVIHVYDLLADRLLETYRFDELNVVYSPSWSPDEKALVFTGIPAEGFADLYVYHRDSGELQQITDDLYDDRDPSWSPDGERIAFSSDRSSEGQHGAYNLFTYSIDTGSISYVTFGDRVDLSPTWGPDANRLAFISTARDSTGHFGAQDVWIADMDNMQMPIAGATSADSSRARPPAYRSLTKLTNLAAAASDPTWTSDNHILFTSFEGLSFTIRQLANVDSLIAEPKAKQANRLADLGPTWDFEQLKLGVDVQASDYKSRYQLDFAHGTVGQSPVIGTIGGAVMAFSDVLGDDYLYFTLLNTGVGGGDFLKELSFQASRFKLNRRANYGYGAFRYAGLRYDVTDPDAPTGLPTFYETVYGGFGLVSYPVSKFTRLEVGTSLNWTNKQIDVRDIDRDALLLANSVSLIHDNALYWYNGPVAGWRSRFTAAYTTDVLYSNVSYYTLVADVRKYFRIWKDVTFASWFMGRINQGREARLWVMGGSWDIRGFHLFEVRGQKMWFTSHELRFPIVNNPSVYLPILAPFGVASLRGAVFFDAAHAWNDDYHHLQPSIIAGETIGAAGIGFRLNLFGSFVLRYDIGRRYRDGFERQDKVFRQFFFGWDF